MLLADSSVWIDHFRSPEEQFKRALGDGHLIMHELVIAELALGSIPDRDKLIAALQLMPRLDGLTQPELLSFISRHELMSKGVGYVDAQLLGSIARMAGARLWTRDKRLHAQAERLGVAHQGS
jgi:predicted nucleic acid-binding protein